MFVPTGMLHLLVTIWLHGTLVGVIADGPFKTTDKSCEMRGELIAKSLIKHRRPQYKGKIKIQLECSEQASRMT